MWVCYLAGMTKGFRNFLDKNQDNWNEIDKMLFKNFSKKNLDNVNPAAELIAEAKIAELNQINNYKKVVKAKKNIIKKVNKDAKRNNKK
tara:strand:+ start:31039 stop:31305 length:267 start_codon:yes stop_codon:yes gene_type:complete